MNDTLKNLEQKLTSAFESLKQEFFGIRTNRPTPKLVEDILVEYYEQKTPIKQLGAISIVPPREIDISLWDKNAVAPTVKALESSGLGITANTDGMLIRINLPSLTDERRQELVKLIKKLAEETRIRVRTLRDEANKGIKDLPEDEEFKSKEKIQDAVNKTNKDIEDLIEKKTNEINE